MIFQEDTNTEITSKIPKKNVFATLGPILVYRWDIGAIREKNTKTYFDFMGTLTPPVRAESTKNSKLQQMSEVQA